jgi:hypothetical protein
MELEKYSIGVGDRFEHQGEAQLQALKKFKDQHLEVVPVWNKSHREHEIIGTKPASVRKEAESAVENLNWQCSYYIDADHIGLDNVDLFMDSSNYFTLDVADMIGEEAEPEEIEEFVDKYKKYATKKELPDELEKMTINEDKIRNIARKYLKAINEAGKIYRHIESKKGKGNFITEVSMDETENPQTPLEMFFILAAIAEENIPAQTIAPKFTGEFYKGIDYVGDVEAFAREIKADLEVISFAVDEFGLPDNLKISIHSGSDKFSIYGPIRKILDETGAGLHIKTAGTTWLEELHGLILAGEEGLEFVKKIYKEALERIDELSAPYKDVINIERSNLPSGNEIDDFSKQKLAGMLVHNTENKLYNVDLRQLLHLSYKLPAENLSNYYSLLEKHEEVIAEQVTKNIYRHLRKVFPH